jgi:ATP-dependent DNA helicase RecG
MSASLSDLQKWLSACSETERLEFKAAENQFDFQKLVNYCCALANEDGGHLILGVTNTPPRQVIGTRAFQNAESIKFELYQHLRFRVDIDELFHPGGRVLVFRVPPRPAGQAVRANGVYWMRVAARSGATDRDGRVPGSTGTLAASPDSCHLTAQ